MKDIDVTTALKYTKELTLLYVEDDLDLQTQTAALFETLFKEVTVKSDGSEALQAYMENEFDIIISDVKMPVMNGLDLAKEIKSMNASQPIVITSAYNENEYLLEFINLHINHFILKPMDTNNLINVIHNVAKNIINAKMVETYRKELEHTNVALKDKNDELESLVRILDSKLTQLSSVGASTKDLSSDIMEISLDNLEELKELETDIGGASVLISLSKNINASNIQVLGGMFKSYSQVVGAYDDYNELQEQIEKLSEVLDSAPQNFIDRVDDISILLESFIYVLRMWRKNLVDGSIKKAFELHASMINDISTIISIIDGTENDIESEMEFF